MASPGAAVAPQASLTPQPRAPAPTPSPSPQAVAQEPGPLSPRERFLASLGNAGTRRAYRAALSAWGRFLETTDGAATDQLLAMGADAANASVQRWLAAQEAAGVSPSLRNQRLVTLRALVKFAGCSWQLDIPSAPMPRREPPLAWRCEQQACAGTRAAPCCNSPARRTA